MCGVSDRLVSAGEFQMNDLSTSHGGFKSGLNDTNGLSKPRVSLLELAANNDLEGFKKAVEEEGDEMENFDSWYCRKWGSNQMAWSRKTPAMIAALYGSLEVLGYILNHVSAHGGDVNKGCEFDGVTALHCAAAGGSKHIVDVVSLLLSNGADPTTLDSQGLRPLDVMRVSPNLTHLKKTVETLLNGSLEPGSPPPQEAFSWSPLESDGSSLSSSPSSPQAVANLVNKICLGLADNKADMSAASLLSSASFASSPGTGGFFPYLAPYPKSPDSASSMKISVDTAEKDPAADSSLPSMKNSMYSTDEFRMFSFKVCPCSRAYSHDWTECPFLHPGENARRRDPRMYHYSCVPCPDFRKGACRRGDACEYAHGVFECWLHPAQYRTRLCKDGASCSRKVCFFAHAKDELRPVSAATGSTPPSLEVTSSSLHLGCTSPPSKGVLPSFTQLSSPHSGVSTPTLTALSVTSSGSNWNQLSSPSSHHSGVGFQSSRLKSASSARDALLDDLSRPSDFEAQVLSEVASLSARARLNAAAAASGCGSTPNRAGKIWNMGLSGTPTNLEELFFNEVTSSLVSPSHVNIQMPSTKSVPSSCQLKASQMANQVMLSSFKQMEGNKGTPLSPSLLAARSILAQRDKRCNSSKGLGETASWDDWASPTGKPDWTVHADDLTKLRKSVSFGLKTAEEPDLSWVQKLLKDGPLDGEVEMGCTGLRNTVDRPKLASWMDPKHLDQIVA